jgi:hypothetical protein
VQRVPVTSASIVSLGYDAATSTLEVEFAGGGVYRYFAVPRAVHESLLKAESVGRTFNVVVRGRYPCTPVA